MACWLAVGFAVDVGCERRLGGASRVLGLMATKDDERVMAEWLDHNMPSLRGLVVFDSSTSHATKASVEAYVARCAGANITYLREDELDVPLASHSDQAVRWWPLKVLRERWGLNNWVMVAHADEFYYHEPELVVQYTEARIAAGRLPRCQTIRWYALPIVPHTSEYDRYIEATSNRHVPYPRVQTLFQHFHTTTRPSKNNVSKHTEDVSRETRLFLDQGRDYEKTAIKKLGTVPVGYDACKLIGPTYMHYKVVDPRPEVYDSRGAHRSHWRGPGAPGVGFGQEVLSSRDFFVEHWRTFTQVHQFRGCLFELLPDQAGIAKLEPLRVDRAWPVAVGDGAGCQKGAKRLGSIWKRTAGNAN